MHLWNQTKLVVTTPRRCFHGFQIASTIEGIWKKVDMLVTKANAVLPAPGFRQTQDRLVKSISGYAPDLVIMSVGKGDAQNKCDEDCPNTSLHTSVHTLLLLQRVMEIYLPFFSTSITAMEYACQLILQQWQTVEWQLELVAKGPSLLKTFEFNTSGAPALLNLNYLQVRCGHASSLCTEWPVTCFMCFTEVIQLDSDLVCPTNRQLPPIYNHTKQLISDIQWVHTGYIPGTVYWTLHLRSLCTENHMLAYSACIHSGNHFPVTVIMDINYLWLLPWPVTQSPYWGVVNPC